MTNPTTDPTTHAEVRRVIEDVETGFNTNDAELMTRHFADDAVVTGANGVPLTGRAEIGAAHEAAVAGFLRDLHVRYTVEDVRAVRPDVVLVRKAARDAGPDGEPTGTEPSMYALYVMAHDGQRWRIVARQNTAVPR